MKTYRQHYDLAAHATHRAKAAYDFALALAIGIGLAAALVTWWLA